MGLSDYRGNSNPTPGSQASDKPILITFGSGDVPIFDTLEVTGDVIFDSLTGILVGNGTSPLTAVTTSAGLAAVISDETGSGSLVFGTAPSLTNPVIVGGTINNAVIGGVTPAAITGTTITATALQIGSGSTTNAGWYAAYSGSSGYGSLWNTGVVANATNYALQSNGSVSALNGTSESLLQISGSTKLKVISTEIQNYLDTVLHSGASLKWGSSSVSSPDTALSRISAASVALGNGNAGNATGTLNLATLSIGNGSTFSLVSTHPTIKAPSGKNVYIAANASGNGTIGFNDAAIFGDTNGAIDLGIAGNAFKRIYFDYTNTAIIGAVTINKAAGRINLAAAASSIVVTNSLVTAASKVFCELVANDATATGIKSVVPAAGSFTVTVNAVATNDLAINFFVVNSD